MIELLLFASSITWVDEIGLFCIKDCNWAYLVIILQDPGGTGMRSVIDAPSNGGRSEADFSFVR